MGNARASAGKSGMEQPGPNRRGGQSGVVPVLSKTGVQSNEIFGKMRVETISDRTSPMPRRTMPGTRPRTRPRTVKMEGLAGCIAKSSTTGNLGSGAIFEITNHQGHEGTRRKYLRAKAFVILRVLGG